MTRSAPILVAPALLLLLATSTRAVENPATAGSPAEPDRIVISGEGAADPVQRVSPETGTRVYQLGPELIGAQGRGPDAGLDEILLHAPGVSRESSGQFHLRGEDYGLQYRLNGIQLPEGITSTLGQPLDSRLIQQVSLVSGALPAQYGLRNAGVINLQTKTGADLGGQEASFYGGSHATIHPSFSTGVTSAKTDFFVTGAFLQDDLGTDNVTPSRDALHDRTRQYQGFGLITHDLGHDQKLSVILSAVDADFQIPNAPGLTPGFAPAGAPERDSRDLDRRQHEQSLYGIVAYQLNRPDFSLLLAETNSYASTHYHPDRPGDLLFTGVASDARRDLLGTALQLDASYRLSDAHTLRAGFSVVSQRERSRSNDAAFPTDPDTGEIVSSAVPVASSFAEHRRGTLYGFYLQDAWRPVRGLTVNFGARFDGVSAYVHETGFSPRLNAVYEFSPRLSVHAGYARVFSPPLLEFIPAASFARFQNTTNAADSLVNDAPRSERSHVFDLGVAWEVLPGLTLGLDGYYKLVRNMQDETQLGSSLVYTPFTYRRGYKRGVELALDYRRDALLLYGNVALAQTEGRDINSAQGLFEPDELRYIATHDIHTDYDQLATVSAGAAYRLQGFTGHADLLFGSGFYGGFANSDQLRSHYTVNVGAAYTLPTWRKITATARFDVINLFDQSYLLHDAGIGATVDQYGERRGFYGGLTCTF